MRYMTFIFKQIFIKVQILILSGLYNFFFRLNPSIKVKKSLSVSGLIKYNVHPKAKFEIGSLRINSWNLINSFGGHRSMIIRVLKGGKLDIGHNVGISSSTIICTKSIVIEDDVLIGGNCHIFDTDFHSVAYSNRMENPDNNVQKRDVLIKRGAFIGGGSYILKGVIIGEESVVAAASVVTKSIPNGEIWGGNPAKFIKKVTL